MDNGWKVERQQTQLQTQSQRILQSSHTQNHQLRVNFTQTKFPLIMGDFEEDGDGSGDPTDLIKKKFEQLSFGNPEDMLNMQIPMQMPSMVMPNLSNFGDTDMVGFNKLGFGNGLISDVGTSMSVSSMRSEKAQVFASSRSSTIQSSQGSVNVHSDIQHQEVKAASVSGLIKNSNSTNIQAASATACSGVTRSFSSSSGFPLPSSSSSFNQLLNRDNLPDLDNSSLTSPTGNSYSSSNNEIPSFENFHHLDGLNISPFRRPAFGFRQIWTDMSRNPNFRNTWDPSTIQSMKTSGSQMQFSASSKTVFQSINGSFRAYKDQRATLLRQSYGASESESDDEDEDDDDGIKRLQYDQRKALPYQPKLAICEKPQYAPSENDDVSISTFEQDDSPRGSVILSSVGSTPEHQRCHKVAQELLSTEITYVRILHLIDQVFHFRVDQENRVSQMFPLETVNQMFCNVKSLYKLHSEHLLPQLQTRLAEWEEDNPKIGDIMKNFAPFLKMYSEYVQNFDNAINLINIFKEKNTRFANIINEIQKMEECANLPIQHHLIGPIQRIPRYRLLLEAYLRKLPETSPDRPDTVKALEIVSKAAEHANEAMRRIASFKKLLEVQEKVKGASLDLVSPTRTFLKEGKISKISARSSDHQERYIFLFSDVILLTSTRPMANRMINSAPYQLRAKLDVAEISVAEGDDLEIQNTFYIQDSQKRIELYTPTPEEKKGWMETIYRARVDLLERKSSLRLGSISPVEDELGLREPAKIRSESVSKCMECHSVFSILKRRHHCACCGSVVCNKCSGTKRKLSYCGGKLCRVCRSCKRILEERENSTKTNGNSPSPPSPEEIGVVPGVLDVPASSSSVISGYLSLRLRGKKDCVSRWFTLRRDFVFYCYMKDTDQRAITATPLPGMSVLLAENLPKSETNLSNAERERAFRVAHDTGRKSFLFLAKNREQAMGWVKILQLAAKADLSSFSSNGNITQTDGNPP